MCFKTPNGRLCCLILVPKKTWKSEGENRGIWKPYTDENCTGMIYDKQMVGKKLEIRQNPREVGFSKKLTVWEFSGSRYNETTSEISIPSSQCYNAYPSNENNSNNIQITCELLVCFQKKEGNILGGTPRLEKYHIGRRIQKHARYLLDKEDTGSGTGSGTATSWLTLDYVLRVLRNDMSSAVSLPPQSAVLNGTS
ncbi:hypothetical protein LXL04_035696 [Taraxacum kok-saghyz]